jgi:hypothetical protein
MSMPLSVPVIAATRRQTGNAGSAPGAFSPKRLPPPERAA